MGTKRYSVDDLKRAVANSLSYRNVLTTIGLKPTGSNYKSLKAKCIKYNIPYSHLGSGCHRPICQNNTKINLSVILVENSTYLGPLKKRLLKANLLEHKCANCGQLPFWNGKELSLAMDHINGINNDNRIENLRILCPNCHSQTETFGSKRFKKYNYCKCGKPIKNKSQSCMSCRPQSNRKRK